MQYPVTKMHEAAILQTNVFWKATFSGSPFTDVEAFSIRVTSIDTPKAAMNNIDVVTHGYPFKHPGTINYSGTITLTFWESVGAEIISAIRAWKSKIYSAKSGDVTGVQEVEHAELFGEIKLELQDRMDRTKQTFTLYNVFLDDFDPGGNMADGATSADYYKPVITVSFSHFDHEKS